MSESVLFIGVGNMGGPMAARLADAGVPLAVTDLSAAALEHFASRGFATAAAGADLPGDVVITILPTDRHVREALLGEDGALARRKRSAVIDMSSSAPGPTKALAAELAERGIAMMDAPVSGGVPKAKTGQLTTMVGGEAQVLARYRPLLAHMCANIKHVGPIGAGDTVKALNNFLSGVSLWAACEALLIGSRAGLDPRTMVEAWSTSTGASNALETKVPGAILPRTFDWGFSLGLISKDVSIAARLARELDIPAPLLAHIEEAWLLAKSTFGEGADFTLAMRVLEQWAGFEVPKSE